MKTSEKRSGGASGIVDLEGGLRARAARAALGMLTLASLAWAGSAVSGVEPDQVGPTVTVTAARDANETPSQTKYVDAVYRKLQGASRYPTSREASLARPSGTAIVWIEVARDGKVMGRGIEQSSGNALLDQEARSLIGRTRFPAFAAGDWGDGATHRFVVGYAFDGVAMTAGKTVASK